MSSLQKTNLDQIRLINIFDRAGLVWYEVESDVGMMGGTGAHEYMAPCAAGEDEVALATNYAANVEIASATAQPVQLGPIDAQIETVSTPGLTRIEDVASALELPKGALLKAFPVIAASRGAVLVVLRGDHSVAEVKLTTALDGEFRPMHAHEVEELIGPPGYTGPAGSKVPVLLDLAVADTAGSGTYVAGANEIDAHLTGVLPGRDFDFEPADIRQVVAGDTVDGQVIRIETTIEAANIFKLGTRYSDALGAYFSDENGKEQPAVMGSYGIGPARIAAAAVEQFADDAGISWPAAIAPYDVQLVSLAREQGAEQELADKLYEELGQLGLSVLYDDREGVGPGAKFVDAELIGLPIRVTVGRKSLERGELELQQRRGRVNSAIPVEGAAAAMVAGRDRDRPRPRVRR